MVYKRLAFSYYRRRFRFKGDRRDGISLKGTAFGNSVEYQHLKIVGSTHTILKSYVGCCSKASTLS